MDKEAVVEVLLGQFCLSVLVKEVLHQGHSGAQTL